MDNGKLAMLWTPENNYIQCNLCNHRCKIPEGKTGFCMVRKNIKGSLYSLVYGKAISRCVDPIEKKPFFHWFPGSDVFSFSTVGCNFRCRGCQNWQISQLDSSEQIEGANLPPSMIVSDAKTSRCKGIAYTYTEPTIFFEYAYDTASLAKAQHLYNVFVTNGYMTPETIEQMKNIDASRIDLKFMDERQYNSYCGTHGNSLDHVLDSIKLLHKKGHIEVINLVVPGMNDNDDAFKATAKFVADLDKSIPLHFIAFYPSNKATDLSQTSVKSLERARHLALDEGQQYSYIGNIPGHPGENTYCPKCQHIAIERYGFQITSYNLGPDHRCKNCGEKILIWDERNYKL